MNAFSVRRLIEIASSPISPLPPCCAHDEGRADLSDLLLRKNGFYCFGGALHVYPSCKERGFWTVEKWNSEDAWRKEYPWIEDGIIMFGQDIFGCQFGIAPSGVVVFDPETGDLTAFSDSLEQWAGMMLSDYNLHTGFQLAHAWQLSNGVIPAGMRLLPKIPFVLGGVYQIENLYCADMLDGMLSRANLAKQIRDLPDGEQVILKVVD